MKKVHDVLIVGAGFSGLGMAIRLEQTGVRDFVVLEREAGVGGTWRVNRYPGCGCDVESHLYSYSFAPNPGWSRMFAPWDEILAYLERCADEFGVRDRIRFGESVRRAAFDERAGLWEVETERGERLFARALVTGSGGLTRPSYPDIPGLKAFGGEVIHSARWNERFSVAGKRIAVIGTGASAIQIVPAIAPQVARLDVYQRTAPWVVPKPDRAIPPAERALFARLPWLQAARRAGIFFKRELFAFGFIVEPRINELVQGIALAHMKRAIKDPVLRDKLTPRYTMGCKRVAPSNDYYPALARDNVELVTERIREVRAGSIVTEDGRERAVDAIVLATGFQASEQQAPFEVRGRGGADLRDAWRDGGEAYLGTSVAGFPNLFTIVGPNTGLGHGSMVFMIEAQIEYILQALALGRRGDATVEVRVEAQREYNREIHARLEKTVWATGGCASWYRTRSGKNTTLFPGFMVEYWRRMRRFEPEKYEIVARRSAVATREVEAAALEE